MGPSLDAFILMEDYGDWSLEELGIVMDPLDEEIWKKEGLFKSDGDYWAPYHQQGELASIETVDVNCSGDFITKGTPMKERLNFSCGKDRDSSKVLCNLT